MKMNLIRADRRLLKQHEGLELFLSDRKVENGKRKSIFVFRSLYTIKYSLFEKYKHIFTFFKYKL